VEEILEIRRQLGRDLYRGTFLEHVEPAGGETADGRADGASPGQREKAFAAALKAAVAQQNRRKRTEERAGRGRARPVRAAADSALVAALREAARGLDDKAADLEEAGCYSEADRLWRLSRQLWRTARRLEQAAPVETRSPAPGGR
jgi:hypothetical protein